MMTVEGWARSRSLLNFYRFKISNSQDAKLLKTVIASASEAIHRAANEEWIASSQTLPCANAPRLSQAMTAVVLTDSNFRQPRRLRAYLRDLAARFRASFAGNVAPSKSEGAGNAGRAMRPQSRMR
jgi:hypothetical protein